MGYNSTCDPYDYRFRENCSSYSMILIHIPSYPLISCLIKGPDCDPKAWLTFVSVLSLFSVILRPYHDSLEITLCDVAGSRSPFDHVIL